MDEVAELTRDLGVWASRTYVVLGVAYVAVIVGGFVSNRNLKDPVKDGGGDHRRTARSADPW